MGPSVIEIQLLWLVGLIVFYLMPIGHICWKEDMDNWNKTGWILLILCIGLFGYAIFLIMNFKNNKDQLQ